jgi:hypothetical protein
LDIEEGAFGNFYSVKGNDNLLIEVVPEKLPVIKNGKAMLDANGQPLMKVIDVLADVRNTMIHNELARRRGFAPRL